MSSPAVIFDERLRVPAEVHELEGFRRWARSEQFPESGRIDFVAGDVEVEMSPEDLHTHGAVKVALAHALHQLIGEEDLGEVFVDRARVSSRRGDLSAEPDLVVVLWESLEAGRVRYLAGAASKPDRYREIAGGPDLVIEIVSDSSVAKDTRRLPARYEAAGVPELWLIDARGEAIDFSVRVLERGSYRPSPVDSSGFTHSPVLSRSVGLSRSRTRVGTWRYRLELA